MDCTKIEDKIQKIIYDLTEKKVNKELNFFSPINNVHPIEMVYIITEIEREFSIDLSKIIAEGGWEKFTVSSISQQISNDNYAKSSFA